MDKLVISGYVSRTKKHLTATDAGKQLLSVVSDHLKSVKMTAEWENKLLMVERGQYDADAFMDEIAQMVRQLVQECWQIDAEGGGSSGGEDGDIKADGGNNSGRQPIGEKRGGRESLGKCPVCRTTSGIGHRALTTLLHPDAIR